MKIAILCKNQKKLASSVAFLRKREIQASTFDTLPDFLQGMKEATFDIMLISLNINHQKPEKIPALMQQMFKLQVIVFCETKDAATQLALNSFRFKIPAQATGPAIAMTVSRVFRELEMEANGKADGVSRQRLGGQSTGDNQQIITMTGGTNESDSAIYLDSARSNRDELHVDSKAGGKKGYFIDHSDFTAEELAAAEAEMAQFELEDESTTSESKLNRANQGGGQSKSGASTSSGRGGSKSSSGRAHPGAGVPDQDNESVDSISQNSTRRNQPHRSDGKKSGDLSHDGDGGSLESDAILDLLSQPPGGSNESDRELSMDAIALWVCALGAVKSVAGDSSRVISRVKLARSCYLLSLRTLKAQGTFVIMLSTSESPAGTGGPLGQRLVDELFQQMQENDFGKPSSNEFDLVEVDPYLIQEEVIARSRFNSSRENEDVQISMSFVTHAEMLSYAEFDDDALVEVPLISVEPEQALDFSIHIKMKVSRSYLRYVNERGSLGRNQAVRLTGYGIRSLYIEKVNHEKYLLHVARQEVNAELKKRGLRLVKKNG